MIVTVCCQIDEYLQKVVNAKRLRARHHFRTDGAVSAAVDYNDEAKLMLRFFVRIPSIGTEATFLQESYLGQQLKSPFRMLLFLKGK